MYRGDVPEQAKNILARHPRAVYEGVKPISVTADFGKFGDTRIETRTLNYHVFRESGGGEIRLKAYDGPERKKPEALPITILNESGGPIPPKALEYMNSHQPGTQVKYYGIEYGLRADYFVLKFKHGDRWQGMHFKIRGSDKPYEVVKEDKAAVQEESTQPTPPEAESPQPETEIPQPHAHFVRVPDLDARVLGIAFDTFERPGPDGIGSFVRDGKPIFNFIFRRQSPGTEPSRKN